MAEELVFSFPAINESFSPVDDETRSEISGFTWITSNAGSTASHMRTEMPARSGRPTDSYNTDLRISTMSRNVIVGFVAQPVAGISLQLAEPTIGFLMHRKPPSMESIKEKSYSALEQEHERWERSLHRSTGNCDESDGGDRGLVSSTHDTISNLKTT
ncbi:hypothetical protein AXF42_Ash014338 [Apostasia shenzhenica]|uniref:Uncharacterized protein n=1 Tax=Apostasia shenzhenica TaxID=1088818 RepID=A0A2I0B0U4_9ASPA|nr:hypothetical protein AXF42_Ash014338 [Apostasia shenzhenica]